MVPQRQVSMQVQPLQTSLNDVNVDIVQNMSKDVSFVWDRAESQDASSNDNIQDDRPERLGLGASYIPHNEAVQLNATLHKRLVKEREKKKRRKRDAEDEEIRQKNDDYEEDEDSRTATFKNKKLKKGVGTRTH